ncbi:unnamed protein product, partial [Effrenium voratum]
MQSARDAMCGRGIFGLRRTSGGREAMGGKGGPLKGARDLLSPALAGILLRAVYCPEPSDEVGEEVVKRCREPGGRHHYLGRYVVRLALEMESEGQRKAPPSLRRRGSQPRQAPKPPSEGQLKAREAEVQRAAARQLWE